MPLVNLQSVINAYPELSIQKIKIKWSKNKTGDMFRNGFKYCGICGYMIKINEDVCRLCNKRFRYRPRTASNIYNLYAESIHEPITIDLRRLVK